VARRLGLQRRASLVRRALINKESLLYVRAVGLSNSAQTTEVVALAFECASVEDLGGEGA
jgi:hypothetical protein